MFKQLALMVPSLRNLHDERNQYARSLSLANDEIKALMNAVSNLQTSANELINLKRIFFELKDANFPVYMNTGVPSFAYSELNNSQQVIVITIPKSGTYLVAAYLKKIGLIDTGVHLDDNGFTDYRNRTINEMVSKYRDFQIVWPLSKSLKLIRRGQFAVGHLGFSDLNVATLSGANVIFITREIRTVLISMMRWLSRPGRDEDSPWKTEKDDRLRMIFFLRTRGTHLLEWFRAIAGWISHKDIFIAQFETLTQVPPTDLAYQLALRIGVDISREDSIHKLQEALGEDTKTRTGAHSKIDDFWSEEAERIFRSIGGVELNQRLGYPN